jgi:hypothetical protein
MLSTHTCTLASLYRSMTSETARRHSVGMPPKIRRGQVVAGEAVSSDDESGTNGKPPAAKPQAKTTVVPAKVASKVVGSRSAQSPAAKPARPAAASAPQAPLASMPERIAEPCAVPEEAVTTPGSAPCDADPRLVTPGSATTPTDVTPRDASNGDEGNSARGVLPQAPRRRRIRSVEIPPASPSAPTSPGRAPHEAAAGVVLHEDAFGDVVVACQVAEPKDDDNSNALDERHGRAEASEPDLVGNPTQHRRNLLAFADDDDIPASRDSSPDVVDPRKGGRGVSMLDRLKQGLRSISAATKDGSSHADPERASTDTADVSRRGSVAQTTDPTAAGTLEASLRRLKEASTIRAPDVVGQYAPTPYTRRCESFRAAVGDRLREELAHRPATGGTEDASARGPSPIACALHETKRVIAMKTLSHGEELLHRHMHAADRRGHLVLQSKANIDVLRATIAAICDTTSAMRTGQAPYFSAINLLVAP